MAMSVPCVATDVGDTAYVIGDTGLVVPPRSPSDLANAIAFLAGEPPLEKARRQLAARERVQQLFSLETIARLHECLYEQLRTA